MTPGLLMKYLLILLLALSQQALSQKISWVNIPPQTDASFRGLSVVDDNVAWVSGTKGWVGKSKNGGKAWTFSQVKGFEKLDFRSIYAFNSKTAVIANAGSPAYILRTTDGGLNWKEVYRNNDTAAFFDGVDFWDNKRGTIFGDPIKGRMLVLNTKDGGDSWRGIPEPHPGEELEGDPLFEAGESSFAASGTAIRCIEPGVVTIATGGTAARLWSSLDTGVTWHNIETPMMHGRNSAGIFSFASIDNYYHVIIVGGDYKQDSLKTDHVFYKKHGDKDWRVPKVPTRGYRECVEAIGKNAVVATGPSGTDITYDGGETWQPLSEEKGLHVVRKSRKGNLVILAGAGGKIVLLKYPAADH